MNCKVNKKIGIVFLLLQVIQEAYLEECRCGKAVGGKVVGGELADVQSYPWLLAIHKKDENSGKWSFGCAASLIHPDWAITAGHCVKNLPKKGTNDNGKCYDETGKNIKCFKSPDELQLALAITQGKKRELSVSRVIPHPEYNPPGLARDIALLKLRNGVTCSSSLMPVCMSEGEHMDYPKTPVITAGWGETKEGGGGGNTELKQTKLKVESKEKCAATADIDGVLCATGTDFGGRTCRGDSGGPLMYVSDGLNYITGVVSYGDSECQITGEVKFTKVTDYLGFIRKYVPLDEVNKYEKDKDYK